MGSIFGLRITLFTNTECLSGGLDESNSKLNRPQLNKALDHIRKGDTLIVCKLDRLTRSLVDLLDILKKLENAGASFRSLGETFETQSAAGRMMMNMVGCFAQFEHFTFSGDPRTVSDRRVGLD
jgi:DNA invertase Pin-like site-specific DNA recombinase